MPPAAGRPARMAHCACRAHRAVICVAALVVAACARVAAASHAAGMQDSGAALGEECSSFEDCTGIATCIGGVCHEQLELGGACDTVVARPNGAEKDYNCVSPMICFRGLCAMPGGIGDACDSYRDCKGGNPCVFGACERYVTRLNSCSNDGDCQGVFCRLGTCRRLRKVGQECQVSDALCGRRMRCMTGVCERVFDTHAQISAEEAALEVSKKESLQRTPSKSPPPPQASPPPPPQASATLPPPPPPPRSSASSPSPIPAQRDQRANETETESADEDDDGRGVSSSAIGASIAGVFGIISVLVVWLLNKHCRNRGHTGPDSAQKLDDMLFK